MKLLIFLSLFIGACYAEISVQNLPINIPNMDDTPAIKERCDSKGGPGTYEKLKAAKDQVRPCLEGLVNVTTVKEEIEEAKKTGSMDEVFGKYCGKRPQIKACIDKLIDTGKLCMEEKEKDALNVTLDIINQLGDFVCYRDGDRIAMFVAEGGPKCLEEHTQGIQTCVKTVFNITESSITPSSLPAIAIDQKQCGKIAKLQDCVVEELEKCKDSTPANIVDAVFRFIRKSACKNKQKRSITKREIANAISTTELKDKMMKVMRDTCIKNGHASDFTKLQQTVMESKTCLQSYRPLITPFNTFKENFERCTKDLISQMENCLPAEGKYYPKLSLDLFISLMKFIYDNLGAMRYNPNNPELSSKRDVAQCFLTLNKGGAQSKLKSCLINVDFGSNMLNMSKEEFCNNLSTKANCVSDVVKAHCIRDITVDQVRDNFVQALTAPCQK